MEMAAFSFLLYFLPIMMAGYFLAGFSRSALKAQNMWIVICSITFYGFCNLIYVPLFVGYVLVHLVVGKYITHLKTISLAEETDNRASLVLKVICVIDVLLLLGWRVLNRFSTGAVLPFGLAFITLKGISYVNDIYRDPDNEPPTMLPTAVYLTFFPTLKAGPIMKYHEVVSQIEARTVTRDKFLRGVCRLVVGLARLILLAAPLSRLTDYIVTQSNMSGIYGTVPVSLMLLSTSSLLVMYYHYYVGYSDLVLGIGSMVGFELTENFNAPVFASSISDFWNRCYISLHGWFQEYVYKPLEKRQDNNDKMVLHTLFMWLLIALWIGSDGSKIVLGIWIFIFIIWEKVVEFNDPVRKKNRILRFIYVMFVMLIAVIALKTNSIYELTMYLGNLLGLRNNGFYSEVAVVLLKENGLTLLIAALTMFPFAEMIRKRLANSGRSILRVSYILYPVCMLGLVVLILVTMTGNSYDVGQYINYQLWSGI